MNVNENFGRISQSIIWIVGGKACDSDYIRNCSNCVDGRIMLAVQYLDRKKKLTRKRLKDLSELYEDFLRCMVSEDQTYQMYGKTHKLLQSSETVRAHFQAMLMQTTTARTKFLAVMAGCFKCAPNVRD